MASNSGIAFLVVFGLIAVGSASDPACGSDATTDPGSESNEDFSFEPEVSTGGAESGDGSGDSSGADDDFSFEPEADAGSSP